MAKADDDTHTKSVGREPKPGERDRACLIVIRGLNVGEMYKLVRADMIIGRGQNADVEILDDGISRKHACIKFSDEQVTVEDLGSRNGTFVNGVRADKVVVLKDGDKIQLSSTTILKFTYADRLDESFQRRMYESALRDGLTKAFNRKYFTDRLEREFRFAKRHKQELSLLLFDIDHFKNVNDSLGHPAGDYVLSTLAAQVHQAIRTEDVFARYGGEEFAVVCRSIDVAGAQFGERLRARIAAFPFSYEGTALKITISVGVSGLTGKHESSEALIASADEAMYTAKHAGRNQVRAAPA